MPQPVLNVTCIMPDYESTGPGEEVYFVKKDGSSLGSLGNMSSLARQINNVGVSGPYHRYFEPVWLASPEPGSKSSVMSFLLGQI
jgi:hypothetical protein